MYDQGSAKITEDGFVFNPPCYFGVSDGISGIYTPEEGPMMFNGKTGGQLASHAISFAFGRSLVVEEPLKTSLDYANNLIRRVSQKKGLSIEKSELLPSATFCIAGVDNQKINIVQGGDTLAVWKTRDGKIGGIPNLIFEYEQRQTSMIAKLIIFSDGLVPFEKTAHLMEMAKFVLGLYEIRGLSHILEITRGIADENKESSHEDYPEATAIAIEF